MEASAGRQVALCVPKASPSRPGGRPDPCPAWHSAQSLALSEPQFLSVKEEQPHLVGPESDGVGQAWQMPRCEGQPFLRLTLPPRGKCVHPIGAPVLMSAKH